MWLESATNFAQTKSWQYRSSQIRTQIWIDRQDFYISSYVDLANNVWYSTVWLDN